MSITIPVWLLWTIGIAIGVPAILSLLFFTALGVVFFMGLGKGGGFWR